MTSTWDLRASLERLVDAVAHQELMPDSSLWETLAESYTDVAFKMGQRIGGGIEVALTSNANLSALDVASTAVQMTVNTFLGELTAAAAMVQLLAGRVAELTGSTVPAVLTDIMDAAQQSEGGA